jgi:hypothetical protein
MDKTWVAKILLAKNCKKLDILLERVEKIKKADWAGEGAYH